MLKHLKMLKHILVVFILGVLTRDASADIKCFLDKHHGWLFTVSAELRFNFAGQVNIYRNDARVCNVAINFDKLESFYQQMNNVTSQLRKDYDSIEECIDDNGGKLNTCASKFFPEDTPVIDQTKAYCKQRDKRYKCTEDIVRESCGGTAAGLNFAAKLKEAEESYMKQVCAIVGGGAAAKNFMWSVVVLCISFLMLMSY